MLNKYIKTGDRIEIIEKQTIMFSQVENTINLREFLIRTPVINGSLAEISVSGALSLVIFTEKGMLRFSASVIESLKQEGFSLLHVKLTSDGERVQRRDYYRLNCKAPFFFTAIKDPNDDFDTENASLGLIEDISGGGARLACNLPMTENEIVRGLIELDDEKALIAGKVLDAQTKFNEYKYQYRIRFLGLPDKDLEIIKRYILKGRRKQLQRG